MTVRKAIFMTIGQSARITRNTLAPKCITEFKHQKPTANGQNGTLTILSYTL